MSVVKHSYIKFHDDGAGRTRAHLKYLECRPGKDKRERTFFNNNRDNISRVEIHNAVSRGGITGVVVHKLVLSPGVNGGDLTAYTREVMSGICSSKGLDLEWYAIAHRNTEHEHVHIVVMGRDKNGRCVRFGKEDYRVMRERADKYLWRNKLLHRGQRERSRWREAHSRQSKLTFTARIHARLRRERAADNSKAKKQVLRCNKRLVSKVIKAKFAYDSPTGIYFRNWLSRTLQIGTKEEKISRMVDRIVRERKPVRTIDKFGRGAM